MTISVVVPVYNEGDSVRTAHDAIVGVLTSQLPHVEFEIVFVDDGSQDDSFIHLSSLCSQYPYVRVIKFVSNSGSHMAIRAGLEHARGDVACFIACDLQDPPEVIPIMLKSLVSPAQIVWAVRGSRQDSLWSQLFAKLFYALARLLVSKNIPPSGASMFLLGADVLKAVRLYTERNLTLEGLFATMGFKQTYVQYERQARRVGHSKWTLGKRLKLFADFFVGYSYTPIRLMSYLGMGIAAWGFIYALVVMLSNILFSIPVAGWMSLVAIVLVIGGIQMTMMGIIGEYVWRTLDETRSRPRYIIDTILDDHMDDKSSTQLR
jgi:dolichol-phosphate mannosyltransferase